MPKVFLKIQKKNVLTISKFKFFELIATTKLTETIGFADFANFSCLFNTNLFRF